MTNEDEHEVPLREDEVCNWCAGYIDESAPRAYVIKTETRMGSRVDRDGEVVAAFHTDLPCYEEARDYGWSQ